MNFQIENIEFDRMDLDQIDIGFPVQDLQFEHYFNGTRCNENLNNLKIVIKNLQTLARELQGKLILRKSEIEYLKSHYTKEIKEMSDKYDLLEAKMLVHRDDAKIKSKLL